MAASSVLKFGALFLYLCLANYRDFNSKFNPVNTSALAREFDFLEATQKVHQVSSLLSNAYDFACKNHKEKRQFCKVQGPPTSNSALVFVSLIQCGDVHPDPGPAKTRKIKFPCTICSKSVTARSKAVSCDMCEEWTHVKCTKEISVQSYDEIVENDYELSFVCSKCSFLNLPFSEDFPIPESNTPGLLATDIHIQILIFLPMTISD